MVVKVFETSMRANVFYAAIAEKTPSLPINYEDSLFEIHTDLNPLDLLRAGVASGLERDIILALPSEEFYFHVNIANNDPFNLCLYLSHLREETDSTKSSLILSPQPSFSSKELRKQAKLVQKMNAVKNQDWYFLYTLRHDGLHNNY